MKIKRREFVLLSDRQIQDILCVLHDAIQFYAPDGLHDNRGVLDQIEKALKRKMYKAEAKDE